jgi:hypothetical protein
MERFITLSKAFITVLGYKNKYSVMTHDGKYAMNIKYYSSMYLMNEYDSNQAYNLAAEAFFNLASKVCRVYGYGGYTLEGRSGGWLVPFYTNEHTNSKITYITATADDYISFDEFCQQEKISSLFSLLKGIKNDLTKMIQYSNSLEEFEKNLLEYLGM